jgi:hypothetical protein
VAFAGTENSSLTLISNNEATIRPVTSSERRDVRIRQLPFAIVDAGVHPMELKQVWSARRAIDATARVMAEAKFGPDGLGLTIDNALGQKIRYPLLSWGPAWNLPEIEAGTARVSLLSGDFDGNFSGHGTLRPELDQTRSRILSAVLSNRATEPGNDRQMPEIFGWLENVDSSIEVDQAKTKTLALVCAPVEVEPSAIGSTVLIESGFCRLIPGPGPEAPYNVRSRQWIAGNRSGSWIIGFQPPAEIGRLRPVRFVLTADVSAPGQTITLSRGICRAGKLDAAAQGDSFAEWRQPISVQSVQLECRDGDFDFDGTIWLRLSVAASSSSSTWFFRKLELSCVASVVSENGK